MVRTKTVSATLTVEVPEDLEGDTTELADAALYRFGKHADDYEDRFGVAVGLAYEDDSMIERVFREAEFQYSDPDPESDSVNDLEAVYPLHEAVEILTKICLVDERDALRLVAERDRRALLAVRFHLALEADVR